MKIFLVQNDARYPEDGYILSDKAFRTYKRAEAHIQEMEKANSEPSYNPHAARNGGTYDIFSVNLMSNVRRRKPSRNRV